MKRYRSRTGPFEQQLHFSPGEIDKMCVEALEAGGFLPSSPQPVRIERFVEKYFACRAGYEDLGPGILGYTRFADDGKIVNVMVSSRLDDGKQISERRVRSTWAHEAGHCLMHPSIFMKQEEYSLFGGSSQAGIHLVERRIMCRESDVQAVAANRRYDGKWWEWQANRAIGAFLLPMKLVKAVVENHLGVTGLGAAFLPSKERRHCELELAEIFDVNPVVARIRLTEAYPEMGAQMEL